MPEWNSSERQFDWPNLGTYTHCLTDWQPLLESLEMGLGSYPREIRDAVTERRRMGCWTGKTRVSMTSVHKKQNKLSRKVVESPSLSVFYADRTSTWRQGCKGIWREVWITLHHYPSQTWDFMVLWFGRNAVSQLGPRFHRQPEIHFRFSRSGASLDKTHLLPFRPFSLRLRYFSFEGLEDSKRILKRPVSEVRLHKLYDLKKIPQLLWA